MIEATPGKRPIMSLGEFINRKRRTGVYPQFREGKILGIFDHSYIKSLRKAIRSHSDYELPTSELGLLYRLSGGELLEIPQPETPNFDQKKLAEMATAIGLGITLGAAAYSGRGKIEALLQPHVQEASLPSISTAPDDQNLALQAQPDQSIDTIQPPDEDLD